MRDRCPDFVGTVTPQAPIFSLGVDTKSKGKPSLNCIFGILNVLTCLFTFVDSYFLIFAPIILKKIELENCEDDWIDLQTLECGTEVALCPVFC